jgi:hypothetical protein
MRPASVFSMTIVVSIIMPIVVSIIVSIVVTIVVPIVAVAVIMLPGIVARFVFFRSNEIDRPIAGMILMTVLAPVSRVSRWYMQVHGRQWRRLRLDDHRLRIHDRRRRRTISQLNLTIDTRCNLPRDNDIDAQIPGAADTAARDQHRDQYTDRSNVHPGILIQLKLISR